MYFDRPRGLITPPCFERSFTAFIVVVLILTVEPGIGVLARRVPWAIFGPPVVAAFHFMLTATYLVLGGAVLGLLLGLL